MTEITVHELIEQLKSIPNQNARVQIVCGDLKTRTAFSTHHFSIHVDKTEVSLLTEGVEKRG